MPSGVTKRGLRSVAIKLCIRLSSFLCMNNSRLVSDLPVPRCRRLRLDVRCSCTQLYLSPVRPESRSFAYIGCAASTRAVPARHQSCSVPPHDWLICNARTAIAVPSSGPKRAEIFPPSESFPRSYNNQCFITFTRNVQNVDRYECAKHFWYVPVKLARVTWRVCRYQIHRKLSEFFSRRPGNGR